MLTIVRVIFLHLSNLICSVSLMVTSKDDLRIVVTPTITLPTSGPVGTPVAVTAHELYRNNIKVVAMINFFQSKIINTEERAKVISFHES